MEARAAEMRFKNSPGYAIYRKSSTRKIRLRTLAQRNHARAVAKLRTIDQITRPFMGSVLGYAKTASCECLECRKCSARIRARLYRLRRKLLNLKQSTAREWLHADSARATLLEHSKELERQLADSKVQDSTLQTDTTAGCQNPPTGPR